MNHLGAVSDYGLVLLKSGLGAGVHVREDKGEKDEEARLGDEF